MIHYLTESAICLGVMLVAYRLFLAKTTLHQVKRGFLLATILAPLLWPLASIDVYYDVEAPAEVQTTEALQVPSINSQGNETELENLKLEDSELLPETETASSAPLFGWHDALTIIYALVTTILLIRLTIHIRQIRRLAKHSEQEQHPDFRLVLLEKTASPYSFFRYIFMGRPEYQEPSLRQQLLTHELVHVKQWHSADVLLIELAKSVLWFNPLYWLLARSIRLNHEFIADAGVIASTESRQSYQNMLLHFYQRPRVNSPLVSPSDFSFIKNRFQMMQKTTRRKTAIVRIALLLPLLGGILFTMAMNPMPREKSIEETKPVTLDLPEQQETETVLPLADPPDGFPIQGVKKSIATWFSPSDRMVWDPKEKTDVYPGLDMTSSPNRVVIATGDGTVLEARNGDERYGNYVMLDHGDEVKTLYASLNEVNVSVGEIVTQGQPLGTTGTSMEVTNLPVKTARVHYAIKQNNLWINPSKYMMTHVVRVTEASAAKRKRVNSVNMPDILPFDGSTVSHMSYTGSIGGSKPKKDALYDNVLGTEFFLEANTTIRTTAAGTVSEIVTDHDWYGNYVKVKHQDGYETMYAKLGEITVTKGQKLEKGHTLGKVGRSGNMYGRFHYKILYNDRYTMPLNRLDGDKTGQPPMLFSFKKEKPKPPHGFSGFYVPWTFPGNFIIKEIYYDQNRAVFVKQNGQVITKKASELSEQQKAALLSLRSKPYTMSRRKRPVPEEVYSRWEKPWVYKILLDGVHIESKEMVNYKPEDFVDCNWVVVSKEVKERHGHAFELYLSTEAYYEKKREDERKRIAEWRADTKEKLSVFKDL